MKTLSVQVQGDHLETLTRTRSPVDAVAELIWNSLDADARDVRVFLDPNSLGGLKAVRVSDNGHGLPYEEALDTFEKLGGSWKRSEGKTRGEGRLLHGKQGKGRFRAFGLGDTVEWQTRYVANGGVSAYTIIGHRSNLATFQVGDVAPCANASPGTDVRVTDLPRDFGSLSRPSAIETLTEELALYLRNYPHVTVVYDGNRIDPSAVESCVKDYDFQVSLEDGREVAAALTVIEWRTPSRRALLLCDAAGFTLHELPPGIQAPGFSFTAYLKADYLRELEAEGAFVLEELHPNLKKLLDRTKDELRAHFRHRLAETATALVDEWKTQNIYPYQGEPRDVIEEVERQVFDVVALNVNEYLPDFEETGPKGKQLAFGLLKEAIGSSPTALQRILHDVLDLPEAKQQELATLLQKTSLEAIINASKLVANRLDFLASLEILLFREPSRSVLLERRQLHRILAEHTWLFGEEFNLTVDDRSLTEVLKAHLKLLGREAEAEAPVVQENGVEGIPDLMLSRLLQPRANEREHLVVELKRPKVSISLEALNQVIRYSTAVADDERFRDTQTRWVFWALSNEMDAAVRRQAHQRNRPEGLVFDDEEQRITIWVKTWGQVIQECQGRLRFFQDHLRYAADNESALAYLRDAHAKYLPDALLKGAPSSPAK